MPPLRLSHDADHGHHLLLAASELHDVATRLTTAGISFVDATDEALTCGGPVWAMLRFETLTDADVARVEQILAADDAHLDADTDLTDPHS